MAAARCASGLWKCTGFDMGFVGIMIATHTIIAAVAVTNASYSLGRM